MCLIYYLFVATHHIVPTRLQTICIHFVLYKVPWLKNIKWHPRGDNLPLFLFCLKELWFFIIPIRTCINSVRKILGNQIIFTSSIKVIPFSKYLSFHLGVVLVHANWANPYKIKRISTKGVSDDAFWLFCSNG